MSCDHQLINDHLVDYIEGRLDKPLRRACEQALVDCALCRDAHEQALSFTRLAAEWDDEAVPAWHRTRFAARPVQRQPAWLGWGALGTSCLTLLLVVFQLEISVDDGLLISFGGSQREAQLQAQLEMRWEALQADQNARLETELAAFATAQNSSNRLLLAEWMEQSRNERRQDVEFIMTAWESQRYRDLQRTDEQLGYLARNQIESDQYLNELAQNLPLTDVNSRGRNPL
jgi:anti-sigma factor RsiW